MREKFDELLARAMELPPEERREFSRLLTEGARGDEVREAASAYVVENEKIGTDRDDMKSVVVALPDDLAIKAQAAGLLSDKRFEELIREALGEEAAIQSRESIRGVERRLVRHNGRLMVEALPEEPPITSEQVRDALDDMGG